MLTVLTSIDQSGLMTPCEILWPDGRRFPIDKVIERGKATQYSGDTTCYTVSIRGRVKKIFFKLSHPNIVSPLAIGTWFAETETE